MGETRIRIDIGRIIKAMLKKCYLIVGTGVVLAAAMYIYMLGKPQYYYATASVYSAAIGSYSETAQGIYTMQLYSSVVNSQKIADRAASLISGVNVTASEIRAMASASYTDESPIMYITATSTNPKVVVATANALAESLVIEAQSVTGTQAIQVLDKASWVGTVQMGKKRNVALAFLIGAGLTALLILLGETLSDRVYRVEDAEIGGKLEIIGIIPEQKIN